MQYIHFHAIPKSQNLDFSSPYLDKQTVLSGQSKTSAALVMVLGYSFGVLVGVVNVDQHPDHSN